MFYIDKDQKEFAMVVNDNDTCKDASGGAPARSTKEGKREGSTKAPAKAPAKALAKDSTKSAKKSMNRLYDLRMPGDEEGKKKEKITRSDLAFMESDQPFILLVHANWCGHCTNMKKDWTLAAEQTKLPVVNVENDLRTHLVQHHPSEVLTQLIRDVDGFPSIFMVKSGKKIPFDKPRTLEEFKTFMKTDKMKTDKMKADKMK